MNRASPCLTLSYHIHRLSDSQAEDVLNGVYPAITGYAPSGLAGAALITPNLPALTFIDQNQQTQRALNLRTDRDSNEIMSRPFLPAAE